MFLGLFMATWQFEAFSYLRVMTHLNFVYCGSVPENGHETALELVSGANFGCVLHRF
jgi:hypothetical protein